MAYDPNRAKIIQDYWAGTTGTDAERVQNIYNKAQDPSLGISFGEFANAFGATEAGGIDFLKQYGLNPWGYAPPNSGSTPATNTAATTATPVTPVTPVTPAATTPSAINYNNVNRNNWGAYAGQYASENAAVKNFITDSAYSGMSRDQILARAQAINPEITSDGMNQWLANNDMGDWSIYTGGGTNAHGATGTAVPTTVTNPVTQSTPLTVPRQSVNLANLQQANQWTVDPKTQTVAGQLESVLASNSPLLQRARTQALQSQNAAGRLNSTMAEGAADAAFYDTALQIATPDAATYADAARTNNAAKNTFSTQANDFINSADTNSFNVNANDWTAGRTSDRTAVRDATLNQYDVAAAATATANQNTRDATLNALDIAKTQTATDAATRTAATSRLNAARADFATALTNITTSTTLGEAPRRDAISQLTTNYNKIIDSALDDLKITGANRDQWRVSGDTPAIDAAAAAATPAVPPVNVVQAVTQAAEATRRMGA